MMNASKNVKKLWKLDEKTAQIINSLQSNSLDHTQSEINCYEVNFLFKDEVLKESIRNELHLLPFKYLHITVVVLGLLLYWC